MQRRQLLKLAAGLPLLSASGLAYAKPDTRSLRFNHLHTGERLNITYCENGSYLPEALAEINRLLRDFRTEEVHVIEPDLLDFMHRIKSAVRSNSTYEIISGYRSPATNEKLRRSSNGVARKSFHMKGQAIDIRLPGVATRNLCRAARKLEMGGVGYYGASDFIHIDVGPVRSW
ncbi:MAG: DUF882 domain-containing protein [Gammaproteobacteria bacterium]